MTWLLTEVDSWFLTLRLQFDNNCIQSSPCLMCDHTTFCMEATQLHAGGTKRTARTGTPHFPVRAWTIIKIGMEGIQGQESSHWELMARLSAVLRCCGGALSAPTPAAQADSPSGSSSGSDPTHCHLDRRTRTRRIVSLLSKQFAKI